MEFISTKGMTNDTAPKGKCLVQYLAPSWGGYSVEFTTGYYDNPNDYNNESDGDGWKSWDSEKKINVISYFELDKIEKGESRFTKNSQQDFFDEFKEWFPNLGSIGE